MVTIIINNIKMVPFWKEYYQIVACFIIIIFCHHLFCCSSFLLLVNVINSNWTTMMYSSSWRIFVFVYDYSRCCDANFCTALFSNSKTIAGTIGTASFLMIQKRWRWWWRWWWRRELQIIVLYDLMLCLWLQINPNISSQINVDKHSYFQQ